MANVKKPPSRSNQIQMISNQQAKALIAAKKQQERQGMNNFGSQQMQ